MVCIANNPIFATAVTPEPTFNNALDDLVSTGASQVKNRTDNEARALLNPTIKLCKTHESTDEDINKSVITAIDAREEAKENSGGAARRKPRPTTREFFQAVSVITRYTNLSGSPKARELEAALDSFCREVRMDQLKLLKATTNSR